MQNGCTDNFLYYYYQKANGLVLVACAKNKITLANGHLRNTSNGQYLLCAEDITLQSGRTTYRVSKIKANQVGLIPC